MHLELTIRKKAERLVAIKCHINKPTKYLDGSDYIIRKLSIQASFQHFLKRRMREKETGQTEELKVVLGVHAQLAKAVHQIHLFITSYF